MRLLFLLALLLACQANALSSGPSPGDLKRISIQFSPISFKAWGSTPSTIGLQLQYRWVMAGYYHIRGNYYDDFRSPTKPDTFGIFFKPDIPFGKKVTIAPITGIFNHRFPTDNSAWWAFGLNLNFNATKNLGFYLQHLSNASTAKVNPGLDMLGMKYSF